MPRNSAVSWRRSGRGRARRRSEIHPWDVGRYLDSDEAIVAYLDGSLSEDNLMDALIGDTRAYAKRQMTWFRRQLQLSWINLEPQSSLEDVAKSIARW